MRTLSTAANQSINAQETGEVHLWILRISHPSLAEPICITDNGVPITHASEVYNPFPFTINLPDEVDGTIPDGQLTICNVDRSIDTALAGLTDAATCEVGWVLASDPDQSLLANGELISYKVITISSDQLVITATLSLSITYDEPLGGDYFNPQNNPGLFSTVAVATQ